jgi:hypothetical protein
MEGALACWRWHANPHNVAAMPEAHESLTAWWLATAQEIVASSGAAEAVRRLEEYYRLVLPDDFRAYLLHGAPGEALWDSEETNWWPVERIRNLPEEYPHDITDPLVAAKPESWLVFADYLIWSGAWAICCAEGEGRGKIAFIGESLDRIVAASFTEFVRRYIADPMSVF